MTEWYALQSVEEQPFATIEEIMKNRYDRSLDPEDTPEDRAMCKGYQEKAEALLKDINQKIATVKMQSKQLPKDAYNTAIMILETMQLELQGLSHIWAGM